MVGYWSSTWSGLKPLPIAALSILLVSGCHDIVQVDIMDKEVELVSPADDHRTDQQSITFYWDEVEGASEYRVQVADPDFDNMQVLLLDSTVGRTHFEHSLPPGQYEWRVRGENNVSETPYSTRSLHIDSTNDISDLEILLKSPPDGLRTNDTAFTFEWFELVGADHYEFRIEDASGGLVLPEDTAQGTTYSLSGVPEGELLWGVRGVNTSTNTRTPYSWDTLVVDTTSPSPPSLTAPADNEVLGDSSQTFEWDPPNDNGTALHDSLFIYSDTNATNTIEALRPSGGSHTDSLGMGTFYWRVRSYDEAGNRGPWSGLRRLDVQ